MEITPLGHASFKIRGKHVTVVTDPYDAAMVGLKFPRHTTADIVTISHSHHDHDFVSLVEGSPFVVRGPGEYEVKGVSITGISTFHDAQSGAERGKNTMYRMEIDGISIVHVGDLGHTLSPEIVDSLDGVDILMIPTGGGPTIGPQDAAAVVAEIEPVIVIPMHYARAGLAKTFSELAPVASFLKEMGKETVTVQPKVTVPKDKLPQELQVVVLE